MDETKDDFERYLERKRAGGVPLDVGVSKSVWMGGILGAFEHEPFVYVGPADWDSEAELTYLADRDAVEALIQRLREAAAEAWPAEYPRR